MKKFLITLAFFVVGCGAAPVATAQDDAPPVQCNVTVTVRAPSQEEVRRIREVITDDVCAGRLPPAGDRDYRDLYRSHAEWQRLDPHEAVEAKDCEVNIDVFGPSREARDALYRRTYDALCGGRLPNSGNEQGEGTEVRWLRVP